MRLGIDVGGTYTDAVLMAGADILASHKALTTPDILSGIIDVLSEVLAQSEASTESIQCVMVGTTQFTNAVVARRDLQRVFALRISLPGGSAIPPLVGWPENLALTVNGGHRFLHGGFEYNGRENCPLIEDEIIELIACIKEATVRQVAITSTFSPLKPDLEIHLAQRLRQAIPDTHITCSYEIGGLGLLDRENAAILNAALGPLADSVINALEAAVKAAGVTAPVFISQNDGTLMNAETAKRYPVMTFSSGPTNSMRGALFLSGVQDALVVDVGGTTADIGMLSGGFPRPSGTEVQVGGVRTNFRMPDVLPIGLGGGSVVHSQGERIGPDSLGHELVSKGLVFGGDVMTASDIGIAAGLADFGDPTLATIDQGTIDTSLATMKSMLADAIDQVKTSAEPLPVIAVGGGAFLVGDDIAGVSEIIRPPHSAIANAVGAALAQVGGEAELLYTRSQEARADAHARVKKQACDKAVAMGADPQSVEILYVDETSLAYMAEGTVRLNAKAVGDLLLDGGLQP
ncbi:MAG: hydantoinase/oxoprolinase family protein [bacterium]|nr:hydantoinase/oxoprolinase family protein [bacterium]